MLRGESLTGPFSPLASGVHGLPEADGGAYEAPAVFKLPDGRWCVMLDYYGVPGKGQGYVPFVAETLASGRFRREQAGNELLKVDGSQEVGRSFGPLSFPYGFKHGTVMEITREEYDRLTAVDEWPEHGG